MRTERLQLRAARWALAALLPLLCCKAALLRAEQPPLQVEIRAHETLARNAHAGIAVVVTVDATLNIPMLITPHVEGSAIELVRGRLLRSDAKVIDATHLLFEVPVVARSEGTAILRVEVATYACTAQCLRVIHSESRVLRVQ